MESPKPGLKDYYAILGVAANASVQDIKKAYRALAHQYHPDRFRSELDTAGASEKMIEINEAFSVLSDAKRREAYDRERNGVKTPRPVVAPAPPDDWRDQIAPKKTVSNPQPSPPTSTVNQTVAKDFLSKIKAQVLQESAEKLQTENEPGWLWALSAKTWTANCWVGLRLVPDLNANVAKELTSQLESLIAKRESGWKKNFFAFVVAYQGLSEGHAVLKCFRTFCNRTDINTARNTVNVVIFDANLRRAVLCGRRTTDAQVNSILRGLGVA